MSGVCLTVGMRDLTRNVDWTALSCDVIRLAAAQPVTASPINAGGLR